MLPVLHWLKVELSCRSSPSRQVAPELLPPQKSPGQGKKGEQAQKGEAPHNRPGPGGGSKMVHCRKNARCRLQKMHLSLKQLEENSSQQDKAGTLLSQAS